MKPIFVKDRNEDTGQKVGLLLGRVVDGIAVGSGIENGVVVDLDKVILGKRVGETEKARLSRTFFLRRARKERMYLTSGIEGKNPDPTVWELKTTAKKGIVQWSTRGQCGIYNEEDPKEIPICAMTGYSRRGKSHKEVSELVEKVMFSDKKEINYKQMSLRGANSQYKEGGHCTPVYSSRSYKMVFDHRRRIVVPKDIKIKYLDKGLPLPTNILYETVPFGRAKESSLYRGLMNKYKQSQYVKYSPRQLPSTKEYEDFNERSVVHDVLSGRGINITCKDPRDIDYNVNREILLSVEESKDKLGKYRASRRLIDNLSKRVVESEKILSNLSKKVRILDSLINFKLYYEDEKYYDVKTKLTINKDRLLLSERKRIARLFASVKINDLLDELGIVGGEGSDDLRRLLRVRSSESMKLVKVRFLPFLINKLLDNYEIWKMKYEKSPREIHAFK